MIFDSLDNLLDHIKQVEADTINISKEAQMKITAFLERNKIEIDDEATEALQYQDIVSQQLNATIEAIESVQQSLQQFSKSFQEDAQKANDSSEKLSKKLTSVLADARAKKEAFSGHVKDTGEEHEIEFF